MLDFHPLLTGEGLVSLVSLVALEIVLGIDNIVFIAIISERIEVGRRSALRRTGLGLALILRLGLLASLSWLMSLTRPLFSLVGTDLSGRDLVLLVGGLFLIAKSAHELFKQSEDEGGSASAPAHGRGDGGGAAVPATAEAAPVVPAQRSAASGGSFGLVLAQILVLDIVFSLDSVITAVGMARQISIMAVAMVAAVGIMLIAANAVSEFITRHPSLKVLALSFLLMIGVLLVADAFDKHVPKGYVYFAMAYALAVELLNIRRRERRKKRAAAERRLSSAP